MEIYMCVFAVCVTAIIIAYMLITQNSNENLNENSNVNLTFEKKDEPQTGCETCKHNKLEWYSAICDSCCGNNNHYEPKDEPQTDIHDLTDCDFCKDRICKDCEGGKDEPQTGCAWK